MAQRFAARWLTACAGLGLWAGAAAQTLTEQSWIVGLPCDQVSVQAVIDNNPQQVIGIACRQPDSRWQFVQVAPTGMALYPTPQDAEGAAPGYPAPLAFGLQSPFGFRDWLRSAPASPAYRSGSGASKGARHGNDSRTRSPPRSGTSGGTASPR
jgi:hypothetical protein